MIVIILGTRPEIIKFSPIIRECVSRKKEFFILHTGQHYSYNLDTVIFEQLNLPKPEIHLDVGSGNHGIQTGKMLTGIENALLEIQPDMVLVQGDTNTTLAGALAASKLHYKVGHVEAGLRSYDKRMPEEINRILVDHCSDYLFTPSEMSAQILLNEGISPDSIFITGNTVVDSISQNIQISLENVRPLIKLNISPNSYCLATIHRQENVDNPITFKSIIRGLQAVSKESDTEIIYPIHPRAAKMIERYDIDTADIRLIEPVDYLSFIQLEKYARLILTDSGGVQEEACILKTPCVTLRDNTEWQETLNVHANILVGTKPENILEGAKKMINSQAMWENPFGKPDSSQRILDVIETSI